jgi:hypothetical protein
MFSQLPLTDPFLFPFLFSLHITGPNSLMRILPSSTLAQAFCPWPTPGVTPMAPSSSSPRWSLPGIVCLGYVIDFGFVVVIVIGFLIGFDLALRPLALLVVLSALTPSLPCIVPVCFTFWLSLFYYPLP